MQHSWGTLTRLVQGRQMWRDFVATIDPMAWKVDDDYGDLMKAYEAPLSSVISDILAYD